MKKKLVGLMIGVLVGTTAMTVFAQETAGEAKTAVFEESDTIVIDDVQAPGAIGGVGGSAAAGQAGDETSAAAAGQPESLSGVHGGGKIGCRERLHFGIFNEWKGIKRN